MSTYWYFLCMAHNPPLRSEGEFTQHTDDGAFREALRVAPLRCGDVAGRDPFGRNAARFFQEHPKCELGIESEYGERRTGLDELKGVGA